MTLEQVAMKIAKQVIRDAMRKKGYKVTRYHKQYPRDISILARALLGTEEGEEIVKEARRMITKK